MRLQRGTRVPPYRQTLKSCTKSINTGRTMFSPAMDRRSPLGITIQPPPTISNVIERWFMLAVLTRVLYLKLKHYQQRLMVYNYDAWRGTEMDVSNMLKWIIAIERLTAGRKENKKFMLLRSRKLSGYLTAILSKHLYNIYNVFMLHLLANTIKY